MRIKLNLIGDKACKYDPINMINISRMFYIKKRNTV